MNEMTEVAVVPERALALNDIKSHVQVIQQVLAHVMVAGTHYGKPFESRRNEEGSAEEERRKMVLLKPGAELLCMTFGIAPQLDLEDLSEGDRIRYRIKCRGISQSGRVLGEGLGECSSVEEKFHWRKAICQEEFDDDQVPGARRKRYRRGKGGTWFFELQIAESAPDKANTVLKMAVKRAMVAMTLHVTACSDMFLQDLEEDDDGAGDETAARKTPQRKGKAGVPPPAPAPAAATPTPEEARKRAKDLVLAKFEELKLPIAQVCQELNIKDFANLTSEEFKRLGLHAMHVEQTRAKAAKIEDSSDIPF